MAESQGSSEKPKGSSSTEDGLVLYYLPMSYFSQKVVFALHEKHLKFQSHFVNLRDGEHFEPWYLKLNPKAQIPVLKDGVKIIPDSSRIIDYLEDNFSNGDTPRLKPEKGSAPYQTMERFQETLDKLNMSLITFGCISHPELTENMKMPPKERTMREGLLSNIIEILGKLPEKNKEFKDFYNASRQGKLEMQANIQNVDTVKKAIAELGSVLETAEKELASHDGDKEKWWLCGEMFTIADMNLAIILQRVVNLGLWNQFFGDSKLPKLNNYYKRMQQRDAFRKTMNPTCSIIGRICCLGTNEKLALSLSSIAIILGFAGLAVFLAQRNK